MTMVPQGALLNPPLPLFSNHHSIQEPILPKFPPQTFDIPDIHDSNSVFNESTFDMNNGVASIKQHPSSSFESSSAAAAASAPPPSAVCRTLMSFPGDWQPNFISPTAESTNSSPVTHSEENNSYDIRLPQPLAQQQVRLQQLCLLGESNSCAVQMLSTPSKNVIAFVVSVLP